MSLRQHDFASSSIVTASPEGKLQQPTRKSSADQFSELARLVMLSNTSSSSNTRTTNSTANSPPPELVLPPVIAPTSQPKQTDEVDSAPTDASTVNGTNNALTLTGKEAAVEGSALSNPGLLHPNGLSSYHGAALTDTPIGSPHIHGRILPSGLSTPRIRATTLDIPGLTRSKVSPDGRISERDVGAKLIILMVGLPARGKSYIVKKVARYLNWLQHPTRIFNVGDRRRVVGGRAPTISSVDSQNKEEQLRESVRKLSLPTTLPQGVIEHPSLLGPPAVTDTPPALDLNGSPISPMNMNGSQMSGLDSMVEDPIKMPAPPQLEQDSKFFDPENQEAKRIREQVAHDTLDDLLKYVLHDGGSVGILDATNHTRERRMSLMSHLKSKNVDVNVLFLESRCQDRNLLQANMRLKLSGPDYKDKDPVKSLRDFQQRVIEYEKKYEPLGDYEEENGIPYCSLIDVGRKMITYQANGFLSVQTISYLMNFNLAPRMIWISRHGESVDNRDGRIGGDSHLTERGRQYAKALERFVVKERAIWERKQIEKLASTHFPPRHGDCTPPNPELATQVGEAKNFCVWTSMMKRSIETAQHFCEEEFDLKQMRMLDELNPGSLTGLTYEKLRTHHKSEYELRKRDKLHYRFPGTGGEGYLDVINRLRGVILEVERMTDHVLLISHRSVSRVLLAYFLGLKQEDIADLDMPLGMAYMLEPRPYGVEFKAYRWNPDNDQFTHEENYRLRRTVEP